MEEKAGISQSLLSLLRSLPENSRPLLQTILYALVAGSSAVGFMFLINYAFAHTFLAFSSRSKLFFLIASFLLVMGSSLIVGLLLYKLSPDDAGSGIPQLKAAYWKELGYVPWRPVLVKFVAGILSIGGGASLGREGPTVFIGGGMASNVAGLMGVPIRQRRSAVVIGASAGLAAAFNAPLAAITFILEEFVGDINSRAIGRVVLASLIGAFVVFGLIGKQPAFTLPSIESVSWVHYLIVPVVALFASLAGVIFHRSTLFLRSRFKVQKVIPGWLLPCCGGFIVWTIGAVVFCTTGKVGVFGLGYHDLSSALDNKFIWWVAGVLVIAKLLATIFSYSSGGCGGIFSPMLFIGGMCGYFIGGLTNLWIPLEPSDRIVLSAVGMSACLGAVVRAPLTSLLIVFEMTHQFFLVPGLMIGTIISIIIARIAGKTNFYDALLLQDGHELIRIRPPLDIQSWQNLPISSIANPHPVVVEDLSEGHLRKTLENHPYNCFPIQMKNERVGLITRRQIESILAHDAVSIIPEAITCHPDQRVLDVGNKFIESPDGVIVVLDAQTNKITGIVTLHDLLRAQASILE